MNIARSSLRVFAARVASTLIGFLGLTFFARELGSHQMGIFFLFQALLGMVAIPVDFGIGGSVTKRLSEGESPGAILSTAILLKGLLLLPFSTGIIVFSRQINDYLGADLALLLVLALVLQEAAKLTMQVLKGELRAGETAAPTFSRKFVYVALGAVMVVTGTGVRGIIYSLLAGLGLMFLWGSWKVSTPLGPPSLNYARSLFNYSKYAFISSIGGYFYSWMDVAIIGFFLTQAEVGVYEIAWRISAVTILFSSSIATVIFPQVSQWSAEDATERIEEILPKAIAPALFFVLPAFFGTLLFSRKILGIVFGSEYSIGWFVLIILMGEKMFQAVHVLLGKSLQGVDRPDLAAKATIVSIGINMVLNIILVFYFGISGAAVATALSFVVNTLLHALYLSQFVTIHLPLQRIAGILVASFGMCVVLRAVQSAFTVSTLPHLIVAISFGIICYILFVLLIPSSRKIVLENISKILP